MKTVLVTGTGSSIGREVALFLGSKGYRILTHGSQMKKPLEETHQLLTKAKIPYAAYLADYTSLDEVEDMCDKILKNESPLEAIIHIAGGANAFGHDKITPKQIIDSMNVNLIATMIITHKLLPLLTEASLIVFTSPPSRNRLLKKANPLRWRARAILRRTEQVRLAPHIVCRLTSRPF